MSEPANIQEFNRVVLHLFTKLYESFPVGIDIQSNTTTVELLGASPEELDAEAGVDAIFEQKMDMVISVVSWLQEEGFLRSMSQTIHGDFVQVRLSMKGLAIMGMPTELENPSKSETVSDKVRKAIESGTTGAISDGMKHILGAAARFGVGYVLGPGAGGPGGMTA